MVQLFHQRGVLGFYAGPLLSTLLNCFLQPAYPRAILLPITPVKTTSYLPLFVCCC